MRKIDKEQRVKNLIDSIRRELTSIDVDCQTLEDEHLETLMADLNGIYDKVRVTSVAVSLSVGE